MTSTHPARIADIRVKDVPATGGEMSVRLMDGRAITVPLAWDPLLAGAMPAQRPRWEVAGGGYGIHWPELDEDLSARALLCGCPTPPGSAVWTSLFAG